MFSARSIASPLGKMLAIADEKKLYLLDFFDRKQIEPMIMKLQEQTGFTLEPASFHNGSPAIDSISQELKEYFEGTLSLFKTPFEMTGSPFQQKVWTSLLTITYATTISYSELANKIAAPASYRAAANANGANKLALIIPCHRVINSDGRLGGYGGGVERKKQLLAHEIHHLHCFAQIGPA